MTRSGKPPKMPKHGREYMGHMAQEKHLRAGHNTILLPGQQPYRPPGFPTQPKGGGSPFNTLPAQFSPSQLQAQALAVQGSTPRALAFTAAARIAKGIPG